MEDIYKEFKANYDDVLNAHNIPYSTIKALAKSVQNSQERTYQGFFEQLDQCIEQLKDEILR